MTGLEILPGSRPRLAAGVRLRFDKARENWTVMAPERVFMLDDVAAEVLQRCDGRLFTELVDDLALAFDAPSSEITTDVKEMLIDLAAKGALDL